jgi:hypothetical protein
MAMMSGKTHVESELLKQRHGSRQQQHLGHSQTSTTTRGGGRATFAVAWSSPFNCANITLVYLIACHRRLR